MLQIKHLQCYLVFTYTKNRIGRIPLIHFETQKNTRHFNHTLVTTFGTGNTRYALPKVYMLPPRSESIDTGNHNT